MAETDETKENELLKLPPLESKCLRCDGDGSRCRLCNSTGEAPTMAGKAVLRLIENHFSAMLRREMTGG